MCYNIGMNITNKADFYIDEETSLIYLNKNTIVEPFVNMKWNGANKQYYTSLGYSFTQMRDSFMTAIQDLSHGCGVRVGAICPICKAQRNVA